MPPSNDVDKAIQFSVRMAYCVTRQLERTIAKPVYDGYSRYYLLFHAVEIVASLGFLSEHEKVRQTTAYAMALKAAKVLDREIEYFKDRVVSCDRRMVEFRTRLLKMWLVRAFVLRNRICRLAEELYGPEFRWSLSQPPRSRRNAPQQAPQYPCTQDLP